MVEYNVLINLDCVVFIVNEKFFFVVIDFGILRYYWLLYVNFILEKLYMFVKGFFLVFFWVGGILEDFLIYDDLKDF